MIAWWKRFSARPSVAHVLRAIERFNLRGGSQLAAAIAYFSVLSLVPILMMTFAGLGLTLTVLMPDALDDLTAWIAVQLQGADQVLAQLLPLIEDSLGNWAAVGILGIAVGFWFGSGWFGNLKRAIRLLMRSDVDNPGKLLPLPLDILANFAGLVALIIGIALTFAASSAATTLTDLVGGALGLTADPAFSVLLRVISLVVAFAAGTGLFWLLFVWFAPEPVPGGHLWVGSAAGSAGLLVLQLLTGYLLQAFTQNITAVVAGGVAGSIIVLMLFLNLFAILILFIAAWLATQSQPADPKADPEPVAEPEPVETRPGQLYVSSKVAEKSLGVGLGTGYVVGTATGLGLGALLVAGIKALLGRRQPR